MEPLYKVSKHNSYGYLLFQKTKSYIMLDGYVIGVQVKLVLFTFSLHINFNSYFLSLTIFFLNKLLSILLDVITDFITPYAFFATISISFTFYFTRLHNSNGRYQFHLRKRLSVQLRL